MNKDVGAKNFKGMNLCTMCSHWSEKEKWVDRKCPLCGQVLILADNAEHCRQCNTVCSKEDIIDGRCPKCR